LGQEEVQELLDNLKISFPNLVETVVPKVMPLNQLTSVMKCILEEGVPISDLRIILESLGSMNIQKMDIDDIAERIRPKLVPLLIQKLVKFKETVPLIKCFF
jgi:flagellar biosynthesis protein FlhA